MKIANKEVLKSGIIRKAKYYKKDAVKIGLKQEETSNKKDDVA